MASLIAILLEIVEMIAANLDYQDVANLLQTSKVFRAFLTQSGKIE